VNAASLSSALAGAAAAMAQAAVASATVLAMAFPSALLTDQQAREANLVAARASSAGTLAKWTAGQRTADFGAVAPSVDARRLADWVAATDDSRGTTFVVIDKRSALVYVFDGQARLLASSPVLLGAALGDGSVPGIGDRPVELVRPEERTTPAGRFVAERGRNARGEDVVWVDYDAAVSMHRVLTTNSAERRLERLASSTAADNRISYGCINLPVAFYESHIRPAFARQSGVVYVLPDVATLQQVFGIPGTPAVQQTDVENARRSMTLKSWATLNG